MWNPLTSQILVGTFHRILRPSRWVGSIRPTLHRGGFPHMVRIVRRSLPVLLAVMALAGLAASAYAQSRPATPPPANAAGTTGRVTGRALEKGKEPVPFANVIILGTKQGTMTDETG